MDPAEQHGTDGTVNRSRQPRSESIFGGNEGSAIGVIYGKGIELGYGGDRLRLARAPNRTVDQLEDMDILSAAGETIGKVDETLANAAGEIVAVSV